MAVENPKPGPEPDRLKIDEEQWEEAVKKALGKKKPREGWPKPKKAAPKDENP